jgi:hypothetical protein
MKKIFLSLVIVAGAFLQPGFAQDAAVAQTSALLTSYYKLKDALVKSSSNMAAVSASEFVKALNEFDNKKLKDESRNNLLADAEAILKSKDIKLQREKFASLSVNIFELAKTANLSTAPVYQQYCPMKKAYWLSGEAAIKNPYYGNQMLTCGKVTETIKQN